MKTRSCQKRDARQLLERIMRTEGPPTARACGRREAFFLQVQEPEDTDLRLKLPEQVSGIIDRLEAAGYEAYAVGGCVRDAVLAREPSDWDITTSARPEAVKRIFRRTVDTGLKHGTVTVLTEDGQYEVTTFRIDGVYLDGRHPEEVIFTPDLKEDLLRRDFTINAMAYSPRTGLVDPYGGMKDLQKKLIRCVGDPDARFDEDALRILRAVRFSAQLGFRIGDKTRMSVIRHAEMLRKISAERIRTELVKLLVSPNPEIFLDLWRLGLTAVFLPEFDLMMETPQHTPWHRYNVGEHSVRAVCAAPADEILRLAMLLHDVGKPALRYTDSFGRDHFQGHGKEGAKMAREILKRLKFDNHTIDEVTTLIYWHEYWPAVERAEVRRAMHQIGPERFPSFLEVLWADTAAKGPYQQEENFAWVRGLAGQMEAVLADGDPLELKDLAIGGEDLLALGVRGREVGRILQGALSRVLEDPAENDRERLLAWAEKEAKGV